MIEMATNLNGLELNDSWRFMDKNGIEICSRKYDWANNFFEGLASVKLNGKWGFIDKTGREAIPCKYDNVCSFREEIGRAHV